MVVHWLYNCYSKYMTTTEQDFRTVTTSRRVHGPRTKAQTELREAAGAEVRAIMAKREEEAETFRRSRPTKAQYAAVKF